MLKRIASNAYHNVLGRVLGTASRERSVHLGHWERTSQESQKLLYFNYREMAHRGIPLPQFAEVGFRAFSQTDEDGILLYIFGLIGTTNRITVEACVERGIECNSANLILNHGWHGLLFDGSEENIQKADAFFRTHRSTYTFPPLCAQAWVETATINQLIVEYGVSGPIDLLNIDIDGMDYWIWEALDCVDPRVVVIELEPSWGTTETKVIPYKRDFSCKDLGIDLTMGFGGASLSALIKLGRRKGYRFVGTNLYGFNAFFVKNGIGEAFLPEVAADTCLKHPYSVNKQEKALPIIAAACPWMNV